MFKQLQRLSKSFMLPIAILPAAGLLLGIGGALSNPNSVRAYPFLDVAFLQGLFRIMASAGEIVFANIALLLCVGLAVGLAKRDKGVAGLAAVVSFLVMNASIGAMINVFRGGDISIDTGTIGSIAIGLMVVFFHNRYRGIVLPPFLGFFGGTRFVPIISAFGAIFVGAIFFIIWPVFQSWLFSAGESISKMGVIGTFFYGFLMRLSGAVGLHHTIYPIFWWTELGGVEMVAGTQVAGAQNIFFAQLADPNHVGLFTHGTRYFAGRFGTMIFGLPAACLAMYHCVPKERRHLVMGIFFSAALTSFITGITEPIEFMFLFVAPWLYVFHAFLDGVSFLVADLLSVRIGNTFSGGIIDFTLFGILQGNARTNWLSVIPQGIAWAALYYGSFTFLIKKFNVGTPGREETEGDDVKLETKATIGETAMAVLAALGGAANVEDCDACITRLRVSVHDMSKVDKDKIVALGATAVLEAKGGLQAIFGAKADLIASKINDVITDEE